MIYTNSDGGARGNPGKAAIGVVIRKGKRIIERYCKGIGVATNNIAEYKAIIEALKIAKKYDKEVTCFLDSELTVKQLNGEYKIKKEHLRRLFEKVKKLEREFKEVKYKHVKRSDKFQSEADKLVKRVLN